MEKFHEAIISCQEMQNIINDYIGSTFPSYICSKLILFKLNLCIYLLFDYIVYNFRLSFQVQNGHQDLVQYNYLSIPSSKYKFNNICMLGKFYIYHIYIYDNLFSFSYLITQ